MRRKRTAFAALAGRDTSLVSDENPTGHFNFTPAVQKLESLQCGIDCFETLDSTPAETLEGWAEASGEPLTDDDRAQIDRLLVMRGFHSKFSKDETR